MNVTINIHGSSSETSGAPGRVEVSSSPGGEATRLTERQDELVAQMGDQIKPFPKAGVDGFFSHFIISLRFSQGPLSGQLLSLAMPPAIQTVSRSDPFLYRGPRANHEVSIPLPRRCTLQDTIRESDFLERPEEYFVEGKETVWMQILNLDARMDIEGGSIRIILGETLKREFPEIYAPSLGGATSLGRRGFPARLFFNPCALVQTPFGSFRAIHGTLAYGRVTDFPPIGTPVTTRQMIPLDLAEDVVKVKRQALAALPPPVAEIIALTHPIDMPMHLPGDEAFEAVEAAIAGAHRSFR